MQEIPASGIRKFSVPDSRAIAESADHARQADVGYDGARPARFETAAGTGDDADQCRVGAESMAKQRTTNSPTADKRARVFLVDDHAIVRQGLAELINDQPDLIICGEADGPAQAIKSIATAEPDVAVLDITLNGGDGIELCRQLKETHPKLVILMLSMHDESLYAMRSIRAGAQGYIMKVSAADQVVTAIRQILAGEIYLSETIAKQTMFRLVGRKKEEAVSPLEDLSDRELEVFQMVGDGLTTRQMADRLHLSVKTIETHKAHIKGKLHLETATQLAQRAIQLRP